MFTDTSNEGYARYFLNIDGEEGSYVKKDDVGAAAFMPSLIYLASTIEQMKSDYHNKIEYEFVLSPVSEEGGFAYLSPAHGIAVN